MSNSFHDGRICFCLNFVVVLIPKIFSFAIRYEEYPDLLSMPMISISDRYLIIYYRLPSSEKYSTLYIPIASIQYAQIFCIYFYTIIYCFSVHIYCYSVDMYCYTVYNMYCNQVLITCNSTACNAGGREGLQ